jgi:hypothetical protein
MEGPSSRQMGGEFGNNMLNLTRPFVRAEVNSTKLSEVSKDAGVTQLETRALTTLSPRSRVASGNGERRVILCGRDSILSIA